MESSLRILMHCGGSYVGGAEVVEIDLMRGLKQRGHKIHCTINGWNDGEFIRRLKDIGVSYTPIKLGRLSKKITDPKYLWWTIDALIHLPGALLKHWQVQNEFTPDVVILHSIRTASKLRPLLDPEKTIHYIHSTPEDTIHTRLAMGNSGGQGAAYVAVSEYIGEKLEDIGVPPKKIEVIQNGVHPGALPRKDTRYPNGGTALKAGIVGQVGPWKGHEDFIEALRILHERGEGVRVQGVIVGEGDEAFEKQLKETIRQYGIEDDVEWRGFVQDTDEIYVGLDVCVVPSRFREPFGLVAAEAGARGLPVIATRRGGLPEIVEDEETGFLVDVGRPDQIADRLNRLANKQDLRSRMGKKARRHVRDHFSVNRMIDQAESLFREIAGDSEANSAERE